MTRSLTKPQMVAEMAERMATDRKTARAALDALTAIIHEEVAGGGTVTIPDVGRITSRERPERMVRNPATGERLKKDADRAIRVTAAKRLKDAANT